MEDWEVQELNEGMNPAPQQQKMWARVRYTVIYTEERVVDIPVPCEFDPQRPEGMLIAIRAAAARLQPNVLSDFFKHEFDLKFKPVEVEAAFDVKEDGEANHEVLYRFRALPVLVMDNLEEVDGELLDSSPPEFRD